MQNESDVYLSISKGVMKAERVAHVGQMGCAILAAGASYRLHQLDVFR